MLSTIISHAIVAILSGGLCYWIGKKGAKNVAGDVQIAVQDVSKKV